MRTQAQTKQRDLQREADRQERLQRLLSSVPHVKRAAQHFDENGEREATRIAQRDAMIETNQ